MGFWPTSGEISSGCFAPLRSLSIKTMSSVLLPGSFKNTSLPSEAQSPRRKASPSQREYNNKEGRLQVTLNTQRLHWVFLLLVCSSLAATARAQISTAELVGTIADPSGAGNRGKRRGPARGYGDSD